MTAVSDIITALSMMTGNSLVFVQRMVTISPSSNSSVTHFIAVKQITPTTPPANRKNINKIHMAGSLNNKIIEKFVLAVDDVFKCLFSAGQLYNSPLWSKRIIVNAQGRNALWSLVNAHGRNSNHTQA